MPIDTTAFRARLAEIQAMSQALHERNIPIFDAHHHFAGSLPGPRMGPDTGGKTGGGKKSGGAKASSAERIASMHASARAWQTANKDAPREVRPGEELKPLPTAHSVKVDFYGPPDTNALLKIYGSAQMGAALAMFPLKELQQTAINSKAPGPLPKDKADLVSAITHHVTNGHYSADFGAPSKAASSKATAPTESPATRAQREAFLTAHAALTSQHAAFLAAHPEVAKHLTAAEKAAQRSAKPKTAPKTQEPSNPLISRLESLKDASDPLEAWRTFGGTRQSVLSVLRRESAGALDLLLRDHRLPILGAGPRPKTREAKANALIDRIEAYYTAHPHERP